MEEKENRNVPLQDSRQRRIIYTTRAFDQLTRYAELKVKRQQPCSLYQLGAELCEVIHLECLFDFDTPFTLRSLCIFSRCIGAKAVAP